MLKEARLYLFNASSRHKYVLTHKENEQLALACMMAKTAMGLGTEMIEAKMIEAVGETIKGALKEIGVAVWNILAGKFQWTDENAFTLSKQTRKLPGALKRDGGSIKSWASD